MSVVYKAHRILAFIWITVVVLSNFNAVFLFWIWMAAVPEGIHTMRVGYKSYTRVIEYCLQVAAFDNETKFSRDASRGTAYAVFIFHQRDTWIRVTGPTGISLARK